MEKANEESGAPRRRYSGEEQALAIKLYEESGLEVAEFCRREGIAPRNFERWLAGVRESSVAFVEVEAQSTRDGGVERSYRLGFAGGGWLEIAGGFEASEVRVLAGIVREESRAC